MSHGPPRAFQPHAYPTPMPAPNHHRPPMMNAHLQTMTTVASAQPLSPAQHNQQATAAAAAAAAVGGSNTSSSGGHMTSSHDSIYCDGCQNVRPASYFPGERRLDYNVCEVCRSREMQKRKQQLERYSNDVYEESQRTFKHNTRPPPPFQQYQYAHQQPHMQHLSPQSLQQQQQHLQAPAPLRMPVSSPQIKPTLPLSSSMIPGMQQVNKPLFPSSLRPQVHHVPASLPLTLPQQQQQTHHEFNQQSPLPSHPPPPLAQPPPRQLHDSDQQMPIRMPVIENEKPQPPPPAPPQTTTPTATTTTSTTATNRSPSKQTDTSCQDILSPEAFVYALQQETEFERKQYVVDINPLIARLGSEAGFTQLGRAICEHILAGTKFNFSMKDRRKSTKAPETLSTLRYYCSQRADTAKPRKGDHPKAANRYDCAGALTVIIDLSKKTSHVTLIHKHSHPPFIPNHQYHHHHQQQQRQQQHQQQQQQHQQQQQQQQQQPDQSNGNPSSSSSINQQQQQQQRQMRLMKQQQNKQTERQFETLKQKVADFGRLIESQQGLRNKEFIQTAQNAFMHADKMLMACRWMENAPKDQQQLQPPNKYTLHYNKPGDF